MWALENLNDCKVFLLKPSEEIIIGRITDLCHLVLFGDSSISRKHASLHIANDVVLTDHSSRYGTFINEGIEQKQKVKPNVPITLSTGDLIRFGLLNHQMRLIKVTFNTCTSTLNTDMKSAMLSHLNILGGKIVDNWIKECNYLTMPKITLTLKFVMALINNSHVVTPEYWKACVGAFNNTTEMPDAKLFIPSVSESSLNQEIVSFFPNPQRKHLFTGKKVIFFSRIQKQKYSDIIISAGGTCAALSETKMTKSKLCSVEVIVIRYLSNPISQESQVNMDILNNIVSYIESKGRRLIPESEIGLAILYCSLDKFCNPLFDFTKQVCGNTPLSTEMSVPANILALETQESTKSKVSLSPKIINASISSIKDSSYNSTDLTCSDLRKRKLVNDEDNSDLQNVKKMNLRNDDNEKIFQFEEEENAPRSYFKTNKNNKQEKILKLVLPMKRNRKENQNEENLFNFECDPEPHTSPKRCKISILGADKVNKAVNVEKNDSRNITPKKVILNESTQWLGKSNHSNIVNNLTIKEEADEVDNVDSSLGTKLKSLDLGQTAIAVNDKLIIKKEINLDGQIHLCGANFKKFRKIQPLRPQKVIIPKSVMTVYRPVVDKTLNAIVSDHEESDDDLLMTNKFVSKKTTVKARRF